MCTSGALCMTARRSSPSACGAGAHLDLLDAHVGAGDGEHAEHLGIECRGSHAGADALVHRHHVRRSCAHEPLAPVRVAHPGDDAQVGREGTAVSATTAFDGSSRLVISAAAR